EDRQGAKEMARLAAPAPADLEVLAIDLLVRVDRALPDVGVVPGDDISSADPGEVQAFGNRGRGAGGLEHDVRAFTMGRVEHGLPPGLVRREPEVQGDVGAHLAGKREPAIR